MSQAYLVGKHLVQHPHNLRTGRVPNKVNRVLVIPDRIVACTQLEQQIKRYIVSMSPEKGTSERSLQFLRIRTCVIDSPEPLVTASLAVLLAVIHLAAL